MKRVRVGNSSGYWGDAPDAMQRMAASGQMDYLTCDYLAEVSMSILRKQQRKNPTLGYIQDFLEHFESAVDDLHKNSIKLITNAGGNNPRALAYEVQKILMAHRIDKKIVVVEGDNILNLIPKLDPESLKHMDSGKYFSGEFTSANAYIGVAGLVKALSLRADIIIAGRVTDSALVLAPLIHELGWRLDNYDLLASGMLAAHCIECGTQITGGNFTDWKSIQDWGDMGFPIIEMQEGGDFIITKHGGTGGLLSTETVKEQLLYEIADPANYYSPDVIADLTGLKFVQLNTNTVLVKGAKGKEPTAYYKVSASYWDGYKATGQIIISGDEALEKAQLLAKVFWERLDIDYYRTNQEYVGYNSCHGNAAKEVGCNEVLLRLHVHDYNEDHVKRFCQQVAAILLSGPQGIAITGGRPRIQEVFAYWPFLVRKDDLSLVAFDMDMSQEHEVVVLESWGEVEGSDFLDEDDSIVLSDEGEMHKLSEICLARSGDKGNNVNIGVIARNEEAYQYLKAYLTPSLLKEWFGDWVQGSIKRYEIPHLNSFNFYLERSLDGGGTRSLRIDAQGKTFAAAVLAQELKIPARCLT